LQAAAAATARRLSRRLAAAVVPWQWRYFTFLAEKLNMAIGGGGSSGGGGRQWRQQ